MNLIQKKTPRNEKNFQNQPGLKLKISRFHFPPILIDFSNKTPGKQPDKENL
jgi:hypothetical protein